MTTATTDMPTLFDDGLVPVFVPFVPTTSIEADFQAFHAANPWVYTALVRLARDLVERGHRRIGIGMLFEVLRWQWALATVDEASEFKLNNNYRSRYARMIMARNNSLDGVFETRTLTAP